MKKSALSLALGLVALGAGAQEVGTVVSSSPVVQQVAVPRQVCDQAVMVQPQTSGGGGLLGAIIGGAIGSQIGGGSGRTAGLLVGTLGGAIAGNQIEANNQRAYAGTQCATQMSYENRTVGYNVTYEYAGKQYTVQMPYDPGPTIRLQMSPMVGNDVAPAQGVAQVAGLSGVVVAPSMQPQPGTAVVTQGPPVVVQQAPVYVQSQPVYVSAPYPYPAYPVAYPVYRPYAPIGVSLNFGYSRGWHRHR